MPCSLNCALFCACVRCVWCVCGVYVCHDAVFGFFAVLAWLWVWGLSPAAESRREKVMTALGQVQRELGACQSQLASSEERRARSSEQVSQLANELGRLRLHANEARRTAEEELDRYHALQRQCDVLHTEVRSLEKDRAQLLEVRRMVQAETEALEAARAQHASLQSQLDGALEAARTARAEARNADMQVAKTNSEHTQLRLELERRKRELDEVRRASGGFGGECGGLVRAVQTALMRVSAHVLLLLFVFLFPSLFVALVLVLLACLTLVGVSLTGGKQAHANPARARHHACRTAGCGTRGGGRAIAA